MGNANHSQSLSRLPQCRGPIGLNRFTTKKLTGLNP
jgi:hypothetical protein